MGKGGGLGGGRGALGGSLQRVLKRKEDACELKRSPEEEETVLNKCLRVEHDVNRNGRLR